MTSVDSKLVEYSIEEIVKFTKENNINEENYLNLIDELNLNKQDNDKLLQMFKIVFKRKNLSLTIGEKITFFFIPFGIFYDGVFQITSFNNTKSDFKKGYFKKQKQVMVFSFLGSIFYLIFFLFLHMINKAS